MTSFYFVNSHNLDPLAYPTISFVVSLLRELKGKIIYVRLSEAN